MLNDPRAIEIIQAARQPNVAQPNRSDRDFREIFTDFFADHDFTGEQVLDIGPGQWDFARMVQEHGGVCVGIDQDPAVLELGRYLGFTAHEAVFQTFDFGAFGGQFHGVFCKFSINAFWWDSSAQTQLVTDIDRLLRPDGWGWIAPWNGRPAARDDDGPVEAQRAAFEAAGWRTLELTPEQVSAYGMGGGVRNNVVFERGLRR